MKCFRFIRIFLYLCLFANLIFLKFTNFFNVSCYIREITGFLCPSCGITRATKAILDFDFISAIQYNEFFVFVLLPIFTILLLDDIFCMILKKKSLVDVIFGF